MLTSENTELIRDERTYSNKFNEEYEEKFDKKSVINYYAGDCLIPIQIAVSSRYICILFEPHEGEQKFHILQRYTNAILYQTTLSTNVSTFHLYDPIDCQIKSNFAEDDAHLIISEYKKAEFSTQNLLVFKISKKNLVSNLIHGIVS
ncbi:UNKNOWN [Stylonychia lemnae]|uniref:Uncharacterized protein n=1 Tax=Stylonychia lemnae TaxID=5949 RepID=A0A078AII4_STYLE|nr:UNKNOWN [Stylonychia lemnae]|eukprot:CDW80623.1 UNKNOWN [Stylonychia lemnae]